LLPSYINISLHVCNTHFSRNAFILHAGSNKDYIVIGSDSGKISIVEYDVALNDWKPVHCEVFGKSGCRRIVPGQYLAADPKGRALIVGKDNTLTIP
jgi:Mono-functional DNA-alkylating methyl methanesulfonate N-term